MTISPRPTPEAEHLAEQERLLAELTEQLATEEAEFAETGRAFARFRAQYLRRFAPLYAELDRLEAEIAQRLADREDTPAARAKAASAATQAEESQRVLDDEAAPNEPEAEEAPSSPPSDDLRAIYRQAAKQIHPDLATDDAEKARRHQLMAALNAAYDAGDAGAIQRILDGEAARPEAIVGDDVGARLMRTIRKIAQVRARFTELVELTNALREDPLFALFEADRADWGAGLDPLAEDEASLRRQVASAHARLAALAMAAAKRPRRRAK